MKKLIILTGISGTGKTTMAKYIQDQLKKGTILTIDTILENLYDVIGFQNQKQKDKIRSIAIQTTKKLLGVCMKREDELIILDYPFSTTWQSYFAKISKTYGYEVLTVKMYGRNFEEIWKRVCIRDLSEARHISHEIDSYDVIHKEKTKQRGIQNQSVLQEIYKMEKRTTITVGKELKITSENEEEKKQAFSKIKEWIEA